MRTYDFKNLSPLDFEELTRDLLQKKLGVYLESFTSGKDSGIDFRHTSDKNGEIIVQAKRYKAYQSLYNKLKNEESLKVQKLRPKKYILSTNVGLTPGNKKNMMNLFQGYLQKTEDIFGRDDLNNLLGLYPEVEKDHFKLWMSNTFIIERILHNKEYALSDFEKSEIEDTIKYYVSNQSFSEALEIIKSNNFVIISGIPGIGKTTLARVIVYHFLSKDYDEFVYISESIDDALKLFREDKKQVFFYDDFLGSNFLREMLSKNEDKRIRTFIERVKKSKNKILILTTREYILNQAKKEYEIFNSNQFDLVKCVIDLSKYNRSIRAKILYNHIFFSGIPHSYILNILDNKNYLNIIDHQNYSPRIISIITKEEKIWESIKAEDFTNKFIEYLDYPQAIWKHAFENQISYLSRMILIQLCVSGTPILIKKPGVGACKCFNVVIYNGVKHFFLY